MTEPRQPSNRPQFRLWHYALAAALAWTALIAATVGWSMFERQRGMLANARHQAQVSFQQEMLLQFWVMGHGDSTPATNNASPSAALARTAKRALFESAAMLRQIQGRSPEPAGYRNRLTSVKPLRPENAPDAWEAAALEAFAKGETEVASVATMDGQEYMRVMRPLVHEASCIMCHGDQDYKVGDIHGGLSVSVPLALLRVQDQRELFAQVITDGVIWVLGLGVIGFGVRRAQAHNLERARAETVLRDSEVRFRQLFENALDGVCLADVQTGMILDCNPALLKLVGREKHEVVGQSQRILHPPSEAIEKVTRSFEQHRQEKAGQSLEVPILTKAGEVRTAEIMASVSEVQGRKTMVGIFRDITERKRAEEISRRERDFSQAALDSLPGLFYLFDDQGRFLRWNKDFEKVSGYSAEEISRMTPLVFFDGTDKGRIADAIQRVFQAGEVTVEADFLSKDQTRTPHFFTGKLFQFEQKLCVMGVGVDITERKRTQAALRASETHYRTLVENIPQNIFIKDRDSRWVSVNENFARGLGRRSEEMVGKGDYDFFPKELAEKYRADDQRIMQTGRKEELEEKHVQGGREIWVRTVKAPVRDERGEITGVFCIFWDVTERKQIEKVQSCLSQLAYQLSLVNDVAQSARLVAESAQDLLGWDACFLRLRSPDLTQVQTMFTMDTVEGRRVEVHNPLAPVAPGPLEQQVMRDGPQIILRSVESDGPPGLIPFGNTGRRSASLLFVPLRHRDHYLGLFSIQSYRVGAYDRAALDLLQALADHAAGAFERIRAGQELESIHKQLVEASRRGGMAEIATNVLHNVGNVLNSVNISTGLIVQSVKQSQASSLARLVTLLQEHAHDLGAFMTQDSRGKHVPAYLAQLSEHLLAEQEANVRELDSLRRNVEHIKEIVAMQQSYATFGGVKEMINVADLVEDSLRLNEGALSHHHVKVIREFEPVPPLNVEKHKVLQILVNLLRNAKHACQDSERADKQITVRVTNGDGRVRISVMDNGVGIPPENLTRIFNHGFTTRKDGHGFGLHSGALAAKEMGGSLTVHSDGPGQGAAFTLELPCAAREDSHE
jgi:PAS domain S-box-containing protein